MVSFKTATAAELVHAHEHKLDLDEPLSIAEKYSRADEFEQQMEAAQREEAQGRLRALPGLARTAATYVSKTTGLDMTEPLVRHYDRRFAKKLGEKGRLKDDLEVRLADYRNRQYEITATMQTHQRKAVAYQNARTELRDLLKQKEQEIDSYGSNLAEQPTDWKLQDQLNKTQVEYQELEDDLQTFDNEIDAHTTAYLKHRRAVDQIALDINEVKIGVATLERAIQDGEEYRHDHSSTGAVGLLRTVGGATKDLYGHMRHGNGRKNSKRNGIEALRPFAKLAEPVPQEYENGQTDQIKTTRELLDGIRTARDRAMDYHRFAQYHKHNGKTEAKADLVM